MMATIEAFRRGDEVCSNVPGSPMMTVLAVEGLKVRCADRENLQYWFDSSALQRCEHPLMHSRGEMPEDKITMGRPVELPSEFWVYAEQLRRAPLSVALDLRGSQRGAL